MTITEPLPESTPESPVSLGAAMRTARMQRGVSLRALAREIGMSASSLSDFETGRSQPADERLALLSAALDVPLPPKRVPRPAPLFGHWREYDEIELDAQSTAGLALFVERGYEGASMRMIAERCGMTVAGLYHHVPSKHDLLVRLMRRAVAELLARCTAADAEAVSPRQRLIQLTEAMVGFHIHRQPWALLLNHERRSLEPDAREEIEGERRRVQQLFVSAVADGRLVPGAVPDRVVARAIVTMCAAIPDWYDEAHRPDPAEIAEYYAAIARDLV